MEGGLSECHSKTVQRLSSLIQFYFPLQETKTRSSTVRQKEALAMKTFIFWKGQNEDERVFHLFVKSASGLQ